ncbi:hypothetical protein BO71DRAFT_75339 [Aspergillus ellipticus CBS 707.79]|uniref:Secreted protein n=1 Tax=Aspergillus ellipticus CBS 707.79 TaxID=1448320 RepID=A0A319D0D0_9EURO|nr:hypothetical protein BO71DRAFT_75339 [Aspergillus ellipticus CBS 707.79]
MHFTLSTLLQSWLTGTMVEQSGCRSCSTARVKLDRLVRFFDGGGGCRQPDLSRSLEAWKSNLSNAYTCRACCAQCT